MLQDAVQIMEPVLVDVLGALEGLADVGWEVPAEHVPQRSLVGLKFGWVRHCIQFGSTYLASLVFHSVFLFSSFRCRVNDLNIARVYHSLGEDLMLTMSES